MIADVLIMTAIGILAAVAVARAESKFKKAQAEIQAMKAAAQAARFWESAAHKTVSEITSAKNEALAWKGAAEQARRNAAEVETAYFSALVEIEKLRIENKQLKEKNPIWKTS